ncbi:MAG: hypothetical protein BWY51_00958 [Parcubacteria group bacterium ADurb.Bin316]|nr:MAG: hypothetical protein BWY51_00958 [Parcubacteria group bacterium ADurb.Bin316]HOZ56083.1 hypothetical protein [bacterium]
MKLNYRAYSEGLKKISGEEMKKKVGVVRMKDASGKFERLEGAALRYKVVDLVRGGKSRMQIVEELKKSGVNMDQFEKRNKIMALIDSLYSKEK